MTDVMKWLLAGDISIQHMTRFLLDTDQKSLESLRGRIADEGFCRLFLSHRTKSGHWGTYYYQPKWTSTHYTLTDIKNLYPSQTLAPCVEMVTRMFDECLTDYGGMNLSKSNLPSDICVDGMILNYAAYFCPNEPRIEKLLRHLISVQKTDGGFSWDRQSKTGCPHTTICVLEGIGEYCAAHPKSITPQIKMTAEKAEQFLLDNRLFVDHSDKRFKKLTYPYRYRYDLLRALEYFAMKDAPFDARMRPAVHWLAAKRKPDGLWNLENRHKGNVHFDMEQPGLPSRFITLKALYILSKYH